MEPHELSDDELDRLLEDTLRCEEPDAERRALAASIRAINRLEPLRREALAPARRRSKIRLVLLLLGWLVTGLVLLLSGEIAELLTGASIDPVFASPVLTQAAAWFSVSPFVFAAAIAALILVSAISVRFAIADD